MRSGTTVGSSGFADDDHGPPSQCGMSKRWEAHHAWSTVPSLDPFLRSKLGTPSAIDARCETLPRAKCKAYQGNKPLKLSIGPIFVTVLAPVAKRSPSYAVVRKHLVS
ncbi:hypothetical protein GQ53DRAFT_208327 [Thozetella sp. PMI_491]|nr:hypothetical protein GQ53DRAFT_208327 [Thozetella sp. PMI_491]